MALTKKNVENVLNKVLKCKTKNVQYWCYISYLEAALQSFDILDVYRDSNYIESKNVVHYYRGLLNVWLKRNIRTRLENKDELVIRLCQKLIEK